MQNEITQALLKSQGFSPSLPRRFWSKVDKITTPESCWPWIASRMPKGYGKIGRGAKGTGWECAHRISWILHYGEIPEGKWVLHQCDNPPCCNPNHLFLGDVTVNNRDMCQKGRGGMQLHPEKSRLCKITPEIVVEMRREYSSTGMTQKEIGRKFGIAPNTAYTAIRGVSWGHIKEGL